jgi:hypothetical protein
VQWESLATLALHHVQLDQASVAQLATALPRLRALALSEVAIGQDALRRTIQSATALEFLSIGNPQGFFDDQILPTLAQDLKACTTLRELFIDNTDADPAEDIWKWGALCALTQLVSLSVFTVEAQASSLAGKP